MPKRPLPKPVYDYDGITLYHGDCLDIIPRLSDGLVGAVVTDPPYGMKNRTNSKRFVPGKNSNLVIGEGRNDWPTVVGDDKPFDPSPWLVFPSIVLWGSNHYAQRLPVGTTLVWVKRSIRLFGSFLSDAEVGWMKGGHGVYCHYEQFPPPCRVKEAGLAVAHPNQKPLGLMTWCLKRLKLPAGSLVLDPYAGSATVGVACTGLGLRYVGIEISPQYVEAALYRLQDSGGNGTMTDMARQLRRRK